jgi:hypothetical protein
MLLTVRHGVGVTPGEADAGRPAIVAGDLFVATLVGDAGGPRGSPRGTACRPGRPAGGLLGPEGELLVLQAGALAQWTSRIRGAIAGAASGRGAAPPALGAVARGSRATAACSKLLTASPGAARPAASGAPASAVAATASHVFVATTRGVFGAAAASRLPATPQAPPGGARSEAQPSDGTSREPEVGAVQRAALRYLELGSDRLARFQRQVTRRTSRPTTSTAHTAAFARTTRTTTRPFRVRRALPASIARPTPARLQVGATLR